MWTVVICNCTYEYDDVTTSNDYYMALCILHRLCGYDAVYQTNENKIVHLRYNIVKNEAMSFESKFKVKWSGDELDDFSDYIIDNILNDKNVFKYDGLIFISSNCWDITNGDNDCKSDIDDAERDDIDVEQDDIEYIKYKFKNEKCSCPRALPKIFICDESRGTMQNKPIPIAAKRQQKEKEQKMDKLSDNSDDNNEQQKHLNKEMNVNKKVVVKSSDFLQSIETYREHEDEFHI